MLTNLRTVRQQRRLSQRQLARMSGLHHGYIHLLEHGLPPREPEHVDRLAEALHVPTAMLIGEPLVKLPAGDAA